MRLPALLCKVRSAYNSPANEAEYCPFVDGSEAELLAVFSRHKNSTVGFGQPLQPLEQGINTAATLYSRSITGATTETVNAVLRRSSEKQKFGLMLGRVNKEIVILLVRPGSMGADAGLSFGDHIVAIDGEQTSDMSAQQLAQRIINQGAARLTLRKQPHINTHTIAFAHGKYCSGLHINNGTVQKIDRNSPASTSGIRVGDVIVKVNETATVMLEDKELMRLVDRRRKKTRVTVQVMSRAMFDAYVRGVRDLSTLKGGV